MWSAGGVVVIEGKIFTQIFCRCYLVGGGGSGGGFGRGPSGWLCVLPISCRPRVDGWRARTLIGVLMVGKAWG